MHLFVITMFLATLGCTTPQGTRVDPENLAAYESGAAAPAVAANSGDAVAMTGSRVSAAEAGSRASRDDPPGDDEMVAKRREFAKRRREHDRRREDLDRGRADLSDKQSRADLEDQSRRASDGIDLNRTERELRDAEESLEHFVDELRARRLRSDEIEVTASRDRLLETREEMAQLELMYDESDLGDATAEIVLERTRRRLALAEQRHVIREARSADLRSIDLPREETALRAAVDGKRTEFENLKRRVAAADLKRGVELRGFEHEQRKLDREDDDLAREAQELDDDVRRWEKKITGVAAGSPSGGASGRPVSAAAR